MGLFGPNIKKMKKKGDTAGLFAYMQEKEFDENDQLVIQAAMALIRLHHEPSFPPVMEIFMRLAYLKQVKARKALKHFWTNASNIADRALLMEDYTLQKAVNILYMDSFSKALQEHFGLEPRRYLEKQLTSPDGEARQMAAAALGYLEDVGALAALEKALEQESEGEPFSAMTHAFKLLKDEVEYPAIMPDIFQG